MEKIQREYIFAVLAKIHEDGGKVIALGKGENFRLTLSRPRQQSTGLARISGGKLQVIFAYLGHG